MISHNGSRWREARVSPLMSIQPAIGTSSASRSPRWPGSCRPATTSGPVPATRRRGTRVAREAVGGTHSQRFAVEANRAGCLTRVDPPPPNEALKCYQLELARCSWGCQTLLCSARQESFDRMSRTRRVTAGRVLRSSVTPGQSFLKSRKHFHGNRLGAIQHRRLAHLDKACRLARLQRSPNGVRAQPSYSNERFADRQGRVDVFVTHRCDSVTRAAEYFCEGRIREQDGTVVCYGYGRQRVSLKSQESRKSARLVARDALRHR